MLMARAERYDLPIRDLRDVEAIERVPIEQRIFSWNLNDWIDRGLSRDPEKIALTYLADGDPEGASVRLTYRELRARATQVANLLHSFGLRPDDVVLLLLPTLPQLYTALIGVLARTTPCCVNWMLGPAQLVELARATRAKAIVSLGPTPGYDIWQNVQAIRGAMPDVRILTMPGPEGTALPASDLDSLVATQDSDRLTFRRSVRGDDVAVLVHSGGTTGSPKLGSPKLVKLTHRGFAYKCWVNALVMGHRGDDVLFADYPMFHIAGLFGRGLLAVAHGMSIVIPSPLGARDKRFIANYWRFVEKFRITYFSGVPTTLATLVKQPPQGEDLSSLRPYMTTGSTAMPAEISRAVEAMIGVRVLLSYGATEFAQNVTQAPRDGDPRYGSAGIRLPYTAVRTVQLDPHGEIARDCAVDEIGMVVVKGPSVTPGYLDARYDDGLFTQDGWIKNGDLGRIDADGYLWLTGRAKDVIIRGGHNIDPSVIEETLQRHPELCAAGRGCEGNARGLAPLRLGDHPGTRGRAEGDHDPRPHAAHRRRQAGKAAVAARGGATGVPHGIDGCRRRCTARCRRDPRRGHGNEGRRHRRGGGRRASRYREAHPRAHGMLCDGVHDRMVGLIHTGCT